jgi:membrane protease YdiL (CAAX protease family)
LTATTWASLREKGPFEPLATLIASSGALRDELARAIPIPSLRDYVRTRLGILAMSAAPMVMLLELDRTSFTTGATGIGRLVFDALLVGLVVVELLRRTPRTPAVAALSLLAIALRWSAIPARMCGRGSPSLVYVGALLPALAALLVLLRVPSRSTVARELLGKLGISPSASVAATRETEPSSSLVAASIACAAGLPALLHITRASGVGLGGQAALSILFAALGPELAYRMAGTPAARRPFVPKKVLAGAAIGLALTAAAATAGRLFFDIGADVARCFARLDTEARLVRAAESSELGHAVAKVRASTLLFVLSSVVFPFVEERIYRGLLQDVLGRRWGTAYGVFAASIAFGLAHLGIYEVAIYQTVLVGIGFGVAYVEGGIAAAVVVHAAWNVLQSV